MNRAIYSMMTTLLLLVAINAKADEFSGKVVGIADGDTVTVLRASGDSKTPVKIRLAGLDTPERSQDYGAKAKQALSSKVFGETVSVVYSEKDRYGRTIGDIYLGSQWVNLQMVSEGWAWHYKQYSKDKQLAQAEAAARQARLGLWADPNTPVPPWEYRRKGKSKSNTKTKTTKVSGTGLYWLNTSSGSRHNESCKYFKNTKKGRMCGGNEGKACGACGG